MVERPVVGCLAVVRRGERVLLVRRSKPPGIGKWGFPGGHLEFGETILACAAREVIEELAVKAAPERVQTAFDFIARDAAGRPERHYALIAVLCRWQSGEGELLSDEASACGWFTLGDAAALDSFPDLLPTLRLVLTDK